MSDTTRAEQLVREKDKAKQDLSVIETFRVAYQLNRSIEVEEEVIAPQRKILGIIAYRTDPHHRTAKLPSGIEREFYSFLGEKATQIGDRVRDIEKELGGHE